MKKWFKDSALKEAFLRRVKKTDKCWIFKGCKADFGYGISTIKGKNIVSHRLSYILHVGPIPKCKLILHKCDNPPCVNPDHLFVGTSRDNFYDMVNKGRARFRKPLVACKRGHKFVKGSYFEMKGRKKMNGEPKIIRSCKECKNIVWRERYRTDENFRKAQIKKGCLKWKNRQFIKQRMGL